MAPLDPDTQQTVLAVVERLKTKPGALLPILHGIQDVLGYIPPAAVPLIADGLNLSRADVHGVISFYHYFRDTKPGRHTIHLCRAEACQSMGSDALAAHAARELGVEFGETTSDEAVTLERVYCLGLCACAPAALFDGEPHARLDQNAISTLIADARK